jgi:hypothetical protein
MLVLTNTFINIRSQSYVLDDMFYEYGGSTYLLLSLFSSFSPSPRATSSFGPPPLACRLLPRSSPSLARAGSGPLDLRADQQNRHRPLLTLLPSQLPSLIAGSVQSRLLSPRKPQIPHSSPNSNLAEVDCQS